ncbi:MAG: DNA-3-methyladenine glycosylase [Candidatus Limnocylindrales bacterium]
MDDPAFDRTLLNGDPEAAARSLIGARLVRRRSDDLGRRVGRIVEVEAYDGPDDRASHARFGPAGRSAPMFGPPGRAYVYRVYGMYTCLNVVVGPPGRPAAVLIRAVEPIEGAAAIRTARLRHDLARLRSTRAAGADPAGEAAARARVARVPDARLAAGPGLVGAAFSVGLDLTGVDVCDPRSPLYLAVGGPADETASAVGATPRIGIDYAGEPWISVPWRFVIADSPAASGLRRRSSALG